MDFNSLKRDSGKAALERLTNEVTKLNDKGSSKDDRFWSPTKDKAGNGYAVIRFLPAPKGEDVPFIRFYDHGFKGPTGKWYIEKSRTSLGSNEKDPCGEFNSMLWNVSKDDASPTRKQARRQKRRLHFVSNIYVVKDSANPEAEGKVWLYKYGKKIFDKLNDTMNPPFAGVDAMNPFDFWAGADFHLKIRTVVEGDNKWPNYDQSSFGQSRPLFADDKELKRIYDMEYPLAEFIDPSTYKSYDELKSLLNSALGESGPSAAITRKAVDEDREWTKQTPPNPGKTVQAIDAEDDDDPDMKFFSRLAAGKSERDLDEDIPF